MNKINLMLPETFQCFSDIIVAAHVEPLHTISNPGKEYSVCQGGTDFPIRSVPQFQSQTGRQRLLGFQGFNQSNNGFFDFGFSLFRQGFKEPNKSGFWLKSHLYRLLKYRRNFPAELKTGPFSRRIWLRSLRSFRENLAETAFAGLLGARTLYDALSSKRAYSSNGNNTTGRFRCIISCTFNNRAILPPNISVTAFGLNCKATGTGVIANV